MFGALSKIPKRFLFRLRGSDALPFLQGLLTNDLRTLTSKTGLYSFLVYQEINNLQLNAQGRFLYETFVYPDNSTDGLILEGSRFSPLMSALILESILASTSCGLMSPSSQ